MKLNEERWRRRHDMATITIWQKKKTLAPVVFVVEKNWLCYGIPLMNKLILIKCL